MLYVEPLSLGRIGSLYGRLFFLVLKEMWSRCDPRAKFSLQWGARPREFARSRYALRPVRALQRAAIALVFSTVSGWATGAAGLPTPADLSRTSRTILDRCIRQENCDQNACGSNGALKNCYMVTQEYLSNNIDAIERMLAKKDGWCSDYWRDLDEQHTAFRDRAMAIKSLKDGPYNTDDDLDLLLTQQKYELVYQVLSNTACSTPAPLLRRRDHRHNRH